MSNPKHEVTTELDKKKEKELLEKDKDEKHRLVAAMDGAVSMELSTAEHSDLSIDSVDKSTPSSINDNFVKFIKGLKVMKQKVDSNAAHKFWDTMPVPKLWEEVETQHHGPVDELKTVEDVKNEPYRLPSEFKWCEIDIYDYQQAKEVFDLLWEHYVEDDDNFFRFKYSIEFIQWCLTPPGYYKDWHLGVRVASNNKLVGFITGIPTRISVHSNELKVAEINFLCVHKKLRSKRLAPVLIQEITRRVNKRNIWQAVYTAGIFLSKPVAVCRYWHRSLNIKKLVAIGFSSLGRRMTLSRAIKLFKVHSAPLISNIRPMKEEDVLQVYDLLKNYLSNFKLHPIFTMEECKHWLLPRENVIHSYVREVDGKITDLTSFYDLPSTVLKSGLYDTLQSAYSFFNVATSVPLKDLISDALCLARNLDYDVYNALDAVENETVFQSLKFGIGDGNLQYYLFNWKCPTMNPSDVALFLM